MNLTIQLIDEKIKTNESEKKIKSAVMTFDPHPSIVIGGRNEKEFYITPLQQKLDTLSAFFLNLTATLAPFTFLELIE